ncbi:MAG: type I-E CRISPR-associated protein Cas7/Cse4/CasC [Clostridiales bacterium]|nr:type I-E CRISPR-associated protein Cas7/Cse4/CasC [Candidatus Apopatocola equi]
MKKHLYLDIHAIQTVPPSCVNRDDTGSPKTAVYGGVERARVSSQAWKHAMRKYFKEIFSPEELGSRTKLLVKLIADQIMTDHPDEEHDTALLMARKALQLAGIPNKDDETEALFFVGREQIAAVAKKIYDDCKNNVVSLTESSDSKSNDTGKKKADKKKMKSDPAYLKAFMDTPSVEIVLFGRMVASQTQLNVDAVAQVAHAISTHAVHTEYDYFTAMDDEKDQSPAAFLQAAEFNSATMYRFATVNLGALEDYSTIDTAKAIRNFVEAFVRSMPTGKQNTFANRTLPDMVYITLREDQPVNFSGAFESPVKNDRGGYAARSCEVLMEYAEKMYGSFADAPVFALGCGDQALEGHAEALSLKAMLERLESIVADQCGKAEE